MVRLAIPSLLFLILISPRPLPAHDDLHKQISELNRRLQQESNSPALWLQRATLFRLHREPDKALADCSRAEQLAPELTDVHLVRGQILSDQNQLEPALAAFNHLLHLSTNHVEGLIARAQVLVRLNQLKQADADFAAALRHAKAPQPDFYLEHADALAVDGRLPDAVRTIDDGIRRLGPIVTLQCRAIDLELQMARFDNALARINLLQSRSPRPETWLALKGKVLRHAGKIQEAEAAFNEALAALQSLPPYRRNTEQIRTLEETIRTALRNLSPPAQSLE